MNGLEISLLIIGAVITLISFISVSKSESNNDIKTSEFNEDKIHKYLEDKIKDYEFSVNEIYDINIDRAHNELSKITSEKMMAIQEFSDQIINDMHDNRQEVLFLYQVLSEKENSIINSDDSLTTNIRDKRTDENQENYNVRDNYNYLDNNMDSQDNTDDDKMEKYKKIIGLYNKGKSINEISKELSLGQGEVKLYIDINKKLVRRKWN